MRAIRASFRKSYQNSSRTVFAGLVAGLCLGCAGGDEWTEKLPETAEVTGVVTLDGEPVEGAAVVFSPDDGKHAGQALTDASGRFSASAFPSKEGLVPGAYKVAISKTVEKKGPKVTGPDAAHLVGGEDVFWVNVLPEKNFNPNMSGLTATIPEEGNSELRYELTSK